MKDEEILKKFDEFLSDYKIKDEMMFDYIVGKKYKEFFINIIPEFIEEYGLHGYVPNEHVGKSIIEKTKRFIDSYNSPGFYSKAELKNDIPQEPKLEDLGNIKDKVQEKVDSMGPEKPVFIPSKEEPIESVNGEKDEVESLGEKEVAKYLKEAGKSLSDSALNIEKSISSMQKIILGLGPNDKITADTFTSIIDTLKKMSGSLRDSADTIAGYRSDIIE